MSGVTMIFSHGTMSVAVKQSDGTKKTIWRFACFCPVVSTGSSLRDNIEYLLKKKK